MKPTQATFRLLVIVALIVIGAVYARDPEFHSWPLSYFHAGTEESTPLPRVASVDWAADGQKLLIRLRGEQNCTMRLVLYDLAQGSTNREINILGDYAHSAVVAPDGRHVLVASYEGNLWWIDLESDVTPEPIIKSSGGTAPFNFTSATISDDGRLIAAGNDLGLIYLYDLPHKSFTVLKSRTESSVRDLCFSRGGRRLAAAQNDGHISVWDLATEELQQELMGHALSVIAVAFLPDGKRIISAGLDDTVRIWDIDLGHELWRGEFNLNGVTTLDLSPDGTIAAWAGRAHKIIVWDLERGTKRLEIATKVQTRDLKFSSDGKLLAAVGYEAFGRLYDVQTAEETRTIDVTNLLND